MRKISANLPIFGESPSHMIDAAGGQKGARTMDVRKRIRTLALWGGGLITLGMTLGSWVGPAFSEEVTFTFAGTVDIVDPRCSDVFNTSQMLTGFYTFETTTSDANPSNPNQGFYLGALRALEVRVGSYTATLRSVIGSDGVERGNFIIYFNDINLGTGLLDNYEVQSAWTGEQLDCFGVDFRDRPVFPDRFFIGPRDEVAPLDALTDILLSPTPPDLSKFTSRQWSLDIGNLFTGFPILRGQLVSLSLPVITVEIDIKPGSDPNSIILSSAGVIPVAIISSESFDALTVDESTVFLASAGVKVAGNTSDLLCHEEDVTNDGLIDLVCQVETAEFMIEPGEDTAELTAQTFDGTDIKGIDSIRIVSD